MIPRISTRDKQFSLLSAAGDIDNLNTTRLSVIVVGAAPALAKSWYKEGWGEEATVPDCYSFDSVKPHKDSSDPQSDMCPTCPQNAWGSRTTPTGQRVKACSDQKRLAVVLADDPQGTVYLLQVTPTSLKNLNNYQKVLQGKSISPEIAKTRLSFEEAVAFPKLVFEFGGFVDDDIQEHIDNLCDSDDVKIVTGELSAYERQPTFSEYGFASEEGFVSNTEV